MNAAIARIVTIVGVAAVIWFGNWFAGLHSALLDWVLLAVAVALATVRLSSCGVWLSIVLERCPQNK